MPSSILRFLLFQISVFIFISKKKIIIMEVELKCFDISRYVKLFLHLTETSSNRDVIDQRFKSLVTDFLEESKNFVDLKTLIYNILDLNLPISLDSVIKPYIDERRDEIFKILMNYVMEKRPDVPNHEIKKERAYLCLSNLPFVSKEDHDKFLCKIDEIENEDFCMSLKQTFPHHCSNNILKSNFYNSMNISKDEVCYWKHPEKKIAVTCPMKLALSSANNSDRHGSAKLEGSKVLNMAIDIWNPSTKSIETPIHGSLELIAADNNDDCAFMQDNCNDKKETQPFLLFESYNDLSGRFREDALKITRQNAEEILGNYENPKDPFRFYKYCFFFVGILRHQQIFSDLQKKLDDTSITSSLWDQLMAFTRGYSLRLNVSNHGPSKSGFSSSSAIMLTILSLLYKAMMQDQILFPNSQEIYHLSLLAELHLKLRSGWNDTLALLPGGIHEFNSVITNIGLPMPTVNNIKEIDCHILNQRLLLVHTGLQRAASGRMNRRHEVYLSKETNCYSLLLQSFKIHDEIVSALRNHRWKQLGLLLSEYMALRIGFDQGATNDDLDFFFAYMKDSGLVYGGMLAGAGGGGIAQLIRSDECTDILLNQALQEIKLQRKAFSNPLYGRIHYAINKDGLKFL